MEFLIIENDPIKAEQYDAIGVENIFIDLEILGKVERQGHLDTVISFNHNFDDIYKVKKVLRKSKLLVRINPINENSKQEINRIIDLGADIIMLPFFKTKNEVELFLEYVNGRVKTNLLFETPQSLVRSSSIVSLDGIDEVHIGLNDMHLGLGLNFMFELLSSGVIDFLVDIFKKSNIPYGIGGIATLENGIIPGKYVLAQYTRLNSSKVILSRTFSKNLCYDFAKIKNELQSIRELEAQYKTFSAQDLLEICNTFNKLVENNINVS